MKSFVGHSSRHVWPVVVLLTTVLAGCGGDQGRDPILGGGGAVRADATRPRVTFTVPATTIPGPTAGPPANAAIIAVFSEDMAPASINSPATAFTVVNTTLGGTPVTGTVSYAVGTRTAVFRPAAELTVDTTYTATISTAATDLANNALAGNQAPLPAASNYVWTFTAAAPAPPANVAVLSTNPVSGQGDVCLSAAINATFSVPSGLRMDPATVSTATFAVTGPAPALTPVPAASVLLDGATGRIATFTPAAPLTADATYTATITGGASGVQDLAIPSNGLAGDVTWNFTAGPASASCAAAVNLGSAATFGIMATSATTSTGPTQINGDVALSPGTSQGIPPGQVNGVIHVNDAEAAQAQADLLDAYNAAKALPPGAGPFALADGADLSGLTLAPGTYTSGSTILINGPAPVTLDAGGNADAVWVFQIGSSLTTVAGGVSLVNGAQARNVFWVPTADATLGSNTTFEGTVLAGRDVTANTGATINGRILAGAIGAATIALDSNTVNVPAP